MRNVYISQIKYIKILYIQLYNWFNQVNPN